MKRQFLAAVVVASAVGCGGQHVQKHVLEISDVTGSALDGTERLNIVAKDEGVTLINSLHAGDSLTVYAFGRTLTSSCEPISADFAAQDNTEEQDQLRSDVAAALPAKYDKYVSCLRDKTTGGSAYGGSPIFGAITEAVEAAKTNGPITQIQLITDGCTWGEGPPTCSAVIKNPGVAKKFISQLPASLKPNLTGIPMTITGLGRGTDMSSAELSALRQIFSDYGEATGSIVRFQ
jgi:hypothetical protein